MPEKTHTRQQLNAATLTACYLATVDQGVVARGESVRLVRERLQKTPLSGRTMMPETNCLPHAGEIDCARPKRSGRTVDVQNAEIGCALLCEASALELTRAHQSENQLRFRIPART